MYYKNHGPRDSDAHVALPSPQYINHWNDRFIILKNSNFSCSQSKSTFCRKSYFDVQKAFVSLSSIHCTDQTEDANDRDDTKVNVHPLGLYNSSQPRQCFPHEYPKQLNETYSIATEKIEYLRKSSQQK